jgi:hypothetical protein
MEIKFKLDTKKASKDAVAIAAAYGLAVSLKAQSFPSLPLSMPLH